MAVFKTALLDNLMFKTAPVVASGSSSGQWLIVLHCTIGRYTASRTMPPLSRVCQKKALIDGSVLLFIQLLPGMTWSPTQPILFFIGLIILDTEIPYEMFNLCPVIEWQTYLLSCQFGKGQLSPHSLYLYLYFYLYLSEVWTPVEWLSVGGRPWLPKASSPQTEKLSKFAKTVSPLATNNCESKIVETLQLYFARLKNDPK